MKITKDKLVQIILEELNEAVPTGLTYSEKSAAQSLGKVGRPGPLSRPGPGYTMDDVKKVFLNMMDMYEALEDQGAEAQESFEKDLSDRFGNMVKEWRRERAGESLFNPSYLSKE